MNAPLDPRRIELLAPEVIAILKTKTPAEKLAMAFDSNRLVRLRIAGHLRMQHPAWSDAEIQSAVLKRLANGAA